MKKSEKSEQRALKSLKVFLCMFQMEGHRTWRVFVASTIEKAEQQLKFQLGKNKVTSKKYFEIDRLTGDLQEL